MIQNSVYAVRAYDVYESGCNTAAAKKINIDIIAYDCIHLRF